MGSIILVRRLQFIILSCLVIGAACAGQRSIKLGYVYFSRDSAIWKLDLSNGQETLLLDGNRVEEISVSPNGKALSYIVLEEIHRGGAKSVWIANTHTGQKTKVSHNMPFLSQSWLLDSRLLVIEHPDWHLSPDGTFLVKEARAQPFIIEPTTGQSILAPWFVASPNNGNVLYAPTFDCAAKTILNNHAQDILQVVCLGSNKPITIATPVSLGNLVWSLDGNLLAFYAGKETATWDSWQLYLWQRDAQVLREIDLDNRVALGLSFSPDSRWLAFEDDSNLCVVNLDDDDSVTCFENYMSAVGIPVSWSFDSHNVVLATCADGICSEIGCDCSNKALVTVAIPSGVITQLTTGVEIVPFPAWGR